MSRQYIKLYTANIGDVVMIYFPFEEDSTKRKRRPAIVIGKKNGNIAVMILKVTSHKVRSVYDYQITDVKSAGLHLGSVIRCNHVVKIRQNINCELRGHLGTYDITKCASLYMKAVRSNAVVQYK